MPLFEFSSHAVSCCWTDAQLACFLREVVLTFGHSTAAFLWCAARAALTNLMDLTVREHIERLQSQLSTLNTEFMDETDPEKRNHLESEIRAVELALSHFEAALELERKLSSQT